MQIGSHHVGQALAEREGQVVWRAGTATKGHIDGDGQRRLQLERGSAGAGKGLLLLCRCGEDHIPEVITAL